MKRKQLLKLNAVMMLPLLSLTACNNDKDESLMPDIPDVEMASVTGDWLENNGDKNMISLAETTYSADGTMSTQIVLINTEYNEIIGYEGNWTESEEQIKESYISSVDGQTKSDSYRKMYCDRYSLILESDEYNTIAQLDRIVDKQTLSIDASTEFTVEDPDFKPISYSSSNPHVASVDDNGHITTHNPGFAYITATSKIGNAVNKITVTSPLVIEDLTKYIGKSINDVTSELGDIYIPVAGSPITFRIFQIPSLLINDLSIGYSMQKVQIVEATFRWNADVKKVMEAWDKAYGTTSTSKDIHSYVIERDGEKYIAMLDTYNYPATMTVLKYVEPSSGGDQTFTELDFTQFAWLPGTPVLEAAERLNYDLTLENIEDGFFDTINLTDNNAFENLSVLFEQEEEPFPVTTIFMRCKKGITEDSLAPYLSKVFTPTGEELNPYTFDVGNGKVYVYFKTQGSRLNVYYSTSKRRK